MPSGKPIFLILITTVFNLLVIKGLSQSPLTLNAKIAPDSSWMDKPLPSEVLAKKKFTLKRRLYQNLITRFNAYYNARVKLDRVVQEARKEHQNNYDSLLTLYPYGPEDFTPMANNLDSVIFDAGYGVGVHDPRSKWIDNLYLIAGKAYYFQQDYANAIDAFKHIIKYRANKDEEGNPEVIGSRTYTSETQISVSTPEEKKLFYHQPSRNDAFVWLIRTYIDSGAFDQARSLINTLKEDPDFPQRLQLDLAKVQAWFFFQQQNTAAGIPFVEKAAALETDKELKARQEYLMGQFYQQKGIWATAVDHYQEVSHLTTDPMMRFYALLNMTEVHILEDKVDFETGSKLLLTMARKEKYDRFRSIIYYSVAQMALKFGLPDRAIAYLQQSLKYNPQNLSQKLRSFYLLAETYYASGHYRGAKAYYDSTATLLDPANPQYTMIEARRSGLEGIVTQLDVIDRQDSLQRLAALPDDQLTAFLRQIVEDSLKAYRKQNRILKGPEEGQNSGGMLMEGQGQPSNRDRRQNTSQTWYFYNNSLKAKGYSLFKSQWGKRALEDNWRGGAAAQGPALTPANPMAEATTGVSTEQAIKEEDIPGAIASLKAQIPLLPDQKKLSDDSILRAMYQEADIFAHTLENDTAAIHVLEAMLSRFPGNSLEAESYYRLSLLYGHLGNESHAASYRDRVLNQFGNSRFAAAMRGPASTDTIPVLEKTTTELYTQAYLDYLSGDYDQVLKLRDSAMHLDPNNAQQARFDLLSAMVTVKQQSDSAGKAALQGVITRQKADTAIAGEAAAMLDALNHKQALIEHLAQLQLPEENENPPVASVYRPATAADTMTAVSPAVAPTAAPDTVQAKAPADTIQTAPVPKQPAVTPYKLSADQPHFVVLAFNRTDKRLIDECLSRFSAYNQKTHPNEKIEVSSFLLARNQVILIFRLFSSEAPALLYYQEIRKKADAAIIPDIPAAYYHFFIISRDNFILLNNTKDYEGYMRFFTQNFR